MAKTELGGKKKRTVPSLAQKDCWRIPRPTRVMLTSFLFVAGGIITLVKHATGSKRPDSTLNVNSLSATKEVRPDSDENALRTALHNLGQQLEVLKKSSILIDSLPLNLRGNGNPTESVKRITELDNAYNNSFATVECCVGTLDYAFEHSHIEINTIKENGESDVQSERYVKSLQTCMAVLDRYRGPIDGMAPKLLHSVLTYQKRRNLEPDGIVGQETWKKIKADVLAASHPRLQ